MFQSLKTAFSYFLGADFVSIKNTQEKLQTHTVLKRHFHLMTILCTDINWSKKKNCFSLSRRNAMGPRSEAKATQRHKSHSHLWNGKLLTLSDLALCLYLRWLRMMKNAFLCSCCASFFKICRQNLLETLMKWVFNHL